jgi:hypothetical protein
MKRFYMLTIIFISIYFSVSNTIAQDQVPMRGPAAERIEQYKKIRLMEAVEMSEETSIRFFSRYHAHEDNMRAIAKERNVLIDRLQQLNQSKASDEDIEKVINDIGTNEEKVANERANFLKELKGVISTKQIADFIIFERNFNRNLRDLMRDIAKERWDRRKGN